jgi:quercetin dioxygenase-like cupin family protein
MTTTRFARRLVRLGTASAVLVSLAAGPVFAAHGYLKHKEAPLAAAGQSASPEQILASAKLRIEELTVQPGAALATSTMKTAVICEMVQGELAAFIDGTSITLKGGDVWACPEERVRTRHTNTGTTQAVMRVFHLVR